MFIKLFAAVCALMLTVTGCASAQTTPTHSTSAETPPSSAVSATVPNTTATPAVEFKEITLVDNESCTVIIKGVEEDALLGYALNVYLENKTDLELMFSVDQVSVNGFMIDPFWATTVTAGKKANQQITFLDSDFETNSITQVEEISFTLNVYDNNDWLADYLVKEVFTVNP